MFSYVNLLTMTALLTGFPEGHTYFKSLVTSSLQTEYVFGRREDT